MATATIEPDGGRPPRRVVASATAFAFAAVLFMCSGFANTLDPYSWTADRQVGCYRGQFCYFHRTSVAGATPPRLATVVGPVWPVVRVRGMESNLASYTLVAVPTWPLFVAVGWLAIVWTAGAMRLRLLSIMCTDRGDQRGFEPIMPPPLQVDALQPPAPTSPPAAWVPPTK